MSDASKRNVTISIVNHGHCAMIMKLLEEIATTCGTVSRVILTNNVKSQLSLSEKKFPFDLVVLDNHIPLGFGSNHNKAFEFCDTDLYCVLNPDIEFLEDPFPNLFRASLDTEAGVVAPQIINSEGDLEDSARVFPTPLMLLKKLFFNNRGIFNGQATDGYLYPDWAAGMFLLFKSDIFKQLRGFDERYFLYYEDIDLSLRVWKSGKKVVVDQNTKVIHNAQRSSHKNFRLFMIHIQSIVTFFSMHLFRFPR